MSNRPSRSLSGKDYTTKKIKFGLFDLELDSSGIEQQTAVILNSIGESKDFMTQLAGRMRGMISDNIRSGKFRDLAESTKEKKKRLGQPTQPLIATGALLGNLEVRARNGYAAVKRGKAEWYAFLHDRGVGRYDERNFMAFTPSQESEIMAAIEGFFDEALKGDK